MKSTLFKTLAIIMGMMMSVSLVSCGDDEDNNEPADPKEIVSYEVTYLADVTKDYLDYFDLTLTYLDASGATKTEVLTGKKSFTVDVPANVMPSKVTFTVHAKRKTTLPAIDNDKIYEFGSNCQLLVNKQFRDKTTGLVGGSVLPVPGKHPIKGDKLEQWLEKYADFDIYTETVDVK